MLVIGGGKDDEPDKPTTLDPCFPCKPVDTTEQDDDPHVQIISAGDLYDVEIRGNTIEDMGANGISAVRFFDLAKKPILIAVRGLHIKCSNRIRRCLRRPINPPPQAMQWMVAYGGIALARATDLRVCGNEIAGNGVDHLEPVCGVFAIMAEGVQLERNRQRSAQRRATGECQGWTARRDLDLVGVLRLNLARPTGAGHEALRRRACRGAARCLPWSTICMLSRGTGNPISERP